MTFRPLCLDQSLTSCGFAFLNAAGALEYGHWHLADNIPQRAGGFVQLHRNLTKLHEQHQFTAIYYESPVKTPVDKVDKLVALYGLVAHVESWARTRRLACDDVAIVTWRKTFLGPSRKGKNRDQLKAMAVSLCEEYGFPVKNTDEAEAIGILDHVLLHSRVDPPWRVAHPLVQLR